MLGTKTKAVPEIGDLVFAKSSPTTVYEDSDIVKIWQEVPSGTNLGYIVGIAPHETGVEVYILDEKGAVFADEVTVQANPEYNYDDSTTGTSGSTNSGVSWSDTFQKVLDLAVGIFGKKKTTTTNTETNVDGDPVTEEPPKTSVPMWVWLTIGGVGLTGVVVALAWPKKKSKPTQEPIYIGPK